jgi:hypothetical protein
MNICTVYTVYTALEVCRGVLLLRGRISGSLASRQVGGALSLSAILNDYTRWLICSFTDLVSVWCFRFIYNRIMEDWLEGWLEGTWLFWFGIGRASWHDCTLVGAATKNRGFGIFEADLSLKKYAQRNKYIFSLPCSVSYLPNLKERSYLFLIYSIAPPFSSVLEQQEQQNIHWNQVGLCESSAGLFIINSPKVK